MGRSANLASSFPKFPSTISLTPWAKKISLTHLLKNQASSGGVTYMNPRWSKQLDRVFSLAQEHGFISTSRTGENNDPESTTLRQMRKRKPPSAVGSQIICCG
jgi:predicted adenine nucleotide alpha hydrolase (AANH) superfamily ATPase